MLNFSQIETAGFESTVAKPDNTKSKRIERFFEKDLEKAMFLFMQMERTLMVRAVGQLIGSDTLASSVTGRYDNLVGRSSKYYRDHKADSAFKQQRNITVTGGKKPKFSFPIIHNTNGHYAMLPSVEIDGNYAQGLPEALAWHLAPKIKKTGQLIHTLKISLDEGSLGGSIPDFTQVAQNVEDMEGKPLSRNLASNDEQFKFFLSNTTFDLRVSIKPSKVKNYLNPEMPEKWEGMEDQWAIRVIQDLEEVLQYAMTFTLYANIDVPLEYANYLTQTTDVPNVVRLNQWATQVFTNRFIYKGAVPSPIASLDDTLEKVKDLREVVFWDKDRLSQTPEAKYLYVPETQDTSVYDKYMEELESMVVTDEDGNPKYDAHAAEAAGAEIKSGEDLFIYNDMRLGQLIYTNRVGTVSVLSTQGNKPLATLGVSNLMNYTTAIPAHDTALYWLPLLVEEYGGLDFTHYMDVKDFAPILAAFLMREVYSTAPRVGDASAVATQFRDYQVYIEDTDSFSTWLTGIKSVCDAVSQVESDTYANVFSHVDPSFDPETLGETSKLRSYHEVPPLTFVLRMMKHIVAEGEKDNFAKLFKRTGVVEGLSLIALYKLVADNIPSDVNTKLQAERELLDQSKLDVDYTPEEVPNIGTHVELLPHQVRVDANSVQEHKHVTRAVQAGGGKTILELIDSLRGLKQGERILGLCPNNLMKNYVKDALYLTKGALNVFCIDSTALKNHGEEALHQRILAAPPNTLFISGFNGLKAGGQFTMDYMGKEIKINPMVEFLREIPWDKVFIDESHKAHNSATNVNQGINRIVSDTKKITLMSGTYIHGTVKYALGQSRIQNPTLLGSTKSFEETFAESTKGNRVTKWKDGSQLEIKHLLEKDSNFVTVRRKEWAALLPTKVERFSFVSLSVNQLKVYKLILKKIADEVTAMPKVKAALDSGDTDAISAVMGQVTQKLTRIEMFLSAPGSDEAGAEMLSGDDLISPKVVEVIKKLDEHFADPDYRDGKVIIFTSFLSSAKAVYDALPERHKALALHYEASKKDQHMIRMETDPNVKIVVGVETSMNEGHNLQMFNHMIRLETAWSPGTLDQAEARINRPNPQNVETRSKIQFNWICAKNTLDITKTALVISKVLSATSFDEAGNKRYDELGNLPVVEMSFNNIFVNNSFDDSLGTYLEKFEELQTLIKEDYADFAANAKHKDRVPVPQGETIEGSAVIDVPYIPNMVIPRQDELGLQNIGSWAIDHNKASVDVNMADLGGRRVHTEFGDGVITRMDKKTMQVVLDSTGAKVKGINKLSAFLIPDSIEEGTDVKDLIYANLDFTREVEEPVEQLIDEDADEEATAEADEPKNEYVTREDFEKLGLKGTRREAVAQGYRTAKEARKMDMESLIEMMVGIEDNETETADEDLLSALSKKELAAIGIEYGAFTAEEAKSMTKADIIALFTPSDDEPTDVVDDEPLDDTPPAKPKTPPSIAPQDDGIEGSVAVFLAAYHSSLGVFISEDDPDMPLAAARKLKLKRTGKTWVAPIKRHQHLRLMIDALNDKFTIPPKQLKVLEELLVHFEKGRSKLLNVESINKQDINQFYKLRKRAVPNGELHVHPLVEDGALYLVVRSEKQPSSNKLKQVKVPGVRWGEQESFYFSLFTTKGEAKEYLKKIKATVGISNMEDVKDSFKAIKIKRAKKG